MNRELAICMKVKDIEGQGIYSSKRYHGFSFAMEIDIRRLLDDSVANLYSAKIWTQDSVLISYQAWDYSMEHDYHEIKKHASKAFLGGLDTARWDMQEEFKAQDRKRKHILLAFDGKDSKAGLKLTSKEISKVIVEEDVLEPEPLEVRYVRQDDPDHVMVRHYVYWHVARIDEPFESYNEGDVHSKHGLLQAKFSIGPQGTQQTGHRGFGSSGNGSTPFAGGGPGPQQNVPTSGQFGGRFHHNPSPVKGNSGYMGGNGSYQFGTNAVPGPFQSPGGNGYFQSPAPAPVPSHVGSGNGYFQSPPAPATTSQGGFGNGHGHFQSPPAHAPTHGGFGNGNGHFQSPPAQAPTQGGFGNGNGHFQSPPAQAPTQGGFGNGNGHFQSPPAQAPTQGGNGNGHFQSHQASAQGGFGSGCASVAGNGTVHSRAQPNYIFSSNGSVAQTPQAMDVEPLLPAPTAHQTQTKPPLPPTQSQGAQPQQPPPPMSSASAPAASGHATTNGGQGHSSAAGPPATISVVVEQQGDASAAGLPATVSVAGDPQGSY